MSATRRRRRVGRRTTSLAGDPLDLFLDAITNALGVIMFILLMVVLFGRANDANPEGEPAPQRQADADRLLREVADLQAKVDALPPAGDPDLAARWVAASERLAAAELEGDRLRGELRPAEDASAAAVARLAARRERLEELAADVERIDDPVARPTGFVRVSKYRADNRKVRVLAVSDRSLSQIVRSKGQREFPPPPAGAGARIADLAAAREVIARMLGDLSPQENRVALMAWEGSFREAKLVEQVLLERGFDWNPVPVAAGKSFLIDEQGGSSVQ